jgi:uncharacterized protein (TIGR02246 family)
MPFDDTVQLKNEDLLVQALYKKLLNSWNDNNARDYADQFTDHANVVGFDGSEVNGREEIYRHINGIFVQHPVAAYVSIVREVRMLGPGIFVLRAVAGMVPPGQTDIKPEVNAIQTMIAVRENDEYKIAVFQNTPAAFHGRPESRDQLSAELRQELR